MSEPRWPEHFSPEVVRAAFGGGRLTSLCLALEAWRRGLSVTFQDRRMRTYRISDGSTTHVFNDSRPQTLTRRADYRRLLSKAETNAHLQRHGIQVPRGVRLEAAGTSEEELRTAAEELGYPLVLKPESGTMGRGVLVGLADWDELRRGFRHLIDELGVGSVLMETHHEGSDHRVLVVGEQVVAATRRVATHVVGDGEQSITELIREKNAARRLNPFLSSGLITVDYEVENLLREQGLDQESVPAPGAHVRLRRIANGSAGADVIDVTDELPDAVKQVAVDATRAFPNIHVAGVDLLHRPPTEGDPGTTVVIELNSRPHIPTNMYPSSGVGRDVPAAMVDHFFPDSARTGDPGDAALVFDHAAVEQVLRTAVAASVEIAPLPDHRYPLRARCTFTPGAELTVLPAVRRHRLERLAGPAQVIGTVRQSGAEVVAVLGAADREGLDRMIAAIAEALRAGPPEQQEWTGVVTAGFTVARGIRGTG